MRRILLLVLVVLSSCSYYSEEQSTGVFVERTHMGKNLLRWEGGNTYDRYREICNTVSQECFVHGLDGPAWTRGMWFAPYYSRSKDILVIYANNTNRKKLDGMKLRLFYTVDGREIECEDCDMGEGPSGETASMYRHADRRFLFSTVRKVGMKQYDSIWLIEVQDDSYAVRLLREIASSAGATFHGVTQLAPSGDSLAWIVCDPDCILVQSDLESGKEEIKPAQCPRNGYSKIEWVGNVATPKCN